jgi:hypothetical protein
VGAGVFFNDKCPGEISTGYFSSSGAFAGGPSKDTNKHYPEAGPNQNPYYGALGAGVGVGAGVFFTNADSVEELGGYFNTVTVDLLAVNLQLSWGGGIFQFGVTAGPAASTGGFSSYPTNTDMTKTTWRSSPCGCK